MHPVFFIDEILKLILSHIQPSRSEGPSWITGRLRRKTFAALARTCKALSEPALDVLWESLRSLLPLLRILPTFGRSQDSKYIILSPVLPEHWARFQLYATRIQSLEYGSSSSEDNILPHVFECLAGLTGDAPLLPKLQRITWRPYRTMGPELIILTTPTLKVASICPYRYVGSIDCHEGMQIGGVQNLELGTILNSLSSSALTLEYLVIEGPLTSSATSGISRFRHLRTLDIGSCGAWASPEAFDKIAWLEHLTDLRISTENLRVNRGEPRHSFRSLRTLHISGTPSSLQSVFCAISSNELHTIVIDGSYSYSPSEWQPCFHVLKTRFCNRLTHFRMNLTLGSLSMTRESENIMEIIRPLLDIPILQVVMLDLEGHLRVDDGDIASMASAWPDLRQFHLWCHKSGKGPTLESLAACAAKCRHLHQLALPADAFGRPSSTANTDSSDHPSIDVVASTTMRSIELLGNVGIADPEWVASRIRTMFPQLRYLEAHSWDPSMAKMWDHVRRSIPHLRRKTRTRLR